MWIKSKNTLINLKDATRIRPFNNGDPHVRIVFSETDFARIDVDGSLTPDEVVSLLWEALKNTRFLDLADQEGAT